MGLYVSVAGRSHRCWVRSHSGCPVLCRTLQLPITPKLVCQGMSWSLPWQGTYSSPLRLYTTGRFISSSAKGDQISAGRSHSHCPVLGDLTSD